MNKRKLKPLHQILAESIEYTCLESGDIEVFITDYKRFFIARNDLVFFGEKVCYFSYPKEWFEDEFPPVPKKRRKLYAYRVGASAIRFHTKEHSEHGRAPEYDLEF